MLVKIKMPDDCHVHLRQGYFLDFVAPYTARHFNRAIVMPNTKPPLTTYESIQEYKKQVPTTFEPKFTLFLTDDTSPDEIGKIKEDESIVGVKLYPANATTGSSSGVSCTTKVRDVLKVMEELDIPLLMHGEDPREPDPFKREVAFIERTLRYLRDGYPDLRMVLEHVSTERGVQFVDNHHKMRGTITPQHLTISRADLFRGNKFNSHFYCMPIVKAEEDRFALLQAAIYSEKFFAGTDSAPHDDAAKKQFATGCFTSPLAVELYAQAFHDWRSRFGHSFEDTAAFLERFLSYRGAEFYGWPITDKMITIEIGEYSTENVISSSDGAIWITYFNPYDKMNFKVISCA